MIVVKSLQVYDYFRPIRQLLCPFPWDLHLVDCIWNP